MHRAAAVEPSASVAASSFHSVHALPSAGCAAALDQRTASSLEAEVVAEALHRALPAKSEQGPDGCRGSQPRPTERRGPPPEKRSARPSRGGSPVSAQCEAVSRSSSAVEAIPGELSPGGGTCGRVVGETERRVWATNAPSPLSFPREAGRGADGDEEAASGVLPPLARRWGASGRFSRKERTTAATPLHGLLFGQFLSSFSFFTVGAFSRMVRRCLLSALRLFLAQLLHLQRRRYLQVCCDPTQRFTHLLSGGRLKAERHRVTTADGYEIFFYRLARVHRHCYGGEAPRVRADLPSGRHAGDETDACAEDTSDAGGGCVCRCAAACVLPRGEKSSGVSSETDESERNSGPSSSQAVRRPDLPATGPRPPRTLSRCAAAHPGALHAGDVPLVSPTDSPLPGLSDDEAGGVGAGRAPHLRRLSPSSSGGLRAPDPPFSGGCLLGARLGSASGGPGEALGEGPNATGSSLCAAADGHPPCHGSSSAEATCSTQDGLSSAPPAGARLSSRDGPCLGSEAAAVQGGLVRGEGGGEPEGGKPIVFLQHGLLESSLNWISGGADSLAFMLVDRGCDVWIGNNRGNEYVRLLPEKRGAKEPAARADSGARPRPPEARAAASASGSDERASEDDEEKCRGRLRREETDESWCSLSDQDSVFTDAEMDIGREEGEARWPSRLRDGASSAGSAAGRPDSSRARFCGHRLAAWLQSRAWERDAARLEPSLAQPRGQSHGGACSQLCCCCTGLTPYPALRNSAPPREERRILLNACVEATGTLMRLMRCSRPRKRRAPKLSCPHQHTQPRPLSTAAGERAAGRSGDASQRHIERDFPASAPWTAQRTDGDPRAFSHSSTRAPAASAASAASGRRGPRGPCLCDGEKLGLLDQSRRSAADGDASEQAASPGSWLLDGRRRRRPCRSRRDTLSRRREEERNCSKQHLPPFSTISTASSQRWTFHDMGMYDVPAMFHHILTLPASRGGALVPPQGREPPRLRRIVALGQSQGAAQLMALTSTVPGVCPLLQALILFSPPVILHPLSSMSLSTRALISLGMRHPAPLLYGIKAAETLFPAPALSVFGDCVAGHRMMGFYTGEIAWNQRCINFKFTPSGGTSKLNFEHWLNVMHGGAPIGQFRGAEPGCAGAPAAEAEEGGREAGDEEMQAILQRETEAARQKEKARKVLEDVGEAHDATPGPAAAYPLEKIACRTYAILGGKDNLVNAEASAEYLTECLDASRLTVQLWPEAGHLDFGWAHARRADLYPELVRLIVSDV